MYVEWEDHSEHIDFVIPTLREARKLVREGALNGRELLVDAGLSEAEADAELARLRS